MCDSDEGLDFLDHNRAVLEPELRMVLPPTDLLRDLTDKARFQRLAERLGLPVPPASAARPAAGGPPALRPPVVVKPVPHRGALWGRLAETDIDVLVQEAVVGPESEIVSHHAYVDQHGEVAGEFTGRKIRTFPAERGMSTALTTTDDPEVAALGREMLSRIGLRGVAKLDFKRSPTGDLRLLEVNPRFTLWAHAGAVAGVNLPALMYAELAGLPRPAPQRARAGVRWVSLRRDREAARAAGTSLVRWLVWALSCETNSAFAWRDPRPLLALRRAAG
jgi:predicted ATP-grasp superfamily ATP-dependent carboligase